MKSARASVPFIFMTVLMDAIGLGVVIPVLPDILRRYSSDPSFVAEYYGYFIALYSLVQLFASPVLGALSDRYGRRPVLLVSLLGSAFDYLLMAFAPSLLILFVGRLISGLTGANYSVANAYMADISTDENRSSNFGLIGAAFGVGFIVGPLIGGLLHQFGPEMPFLVAALLCFINFLFGWLVLPESLTPEKRRDLQIQSLNPFPILINGLRRKETRALFWMYGLTSLAGHVHPSNWTLYTQTKFSWTATEVGWSLTFVGVCLAISQSWLTRVLIPKLGEPRAMWVGFGIEALGFFLFAFATESWMMYAVTIPWSISAIGLPALQSIASKMTSEDRQGELQGVMMSLMSVTAVIAPLIYTTLFRTFTDFHGVAYFTAGIIGAVAAVIALSYRPRSI